MTSYELAPEAEKIGRQLIKEVPRHKNLGYVEVVWVWRDHASKSKGRLVLAKARKVSGLNAFLRHQEDTEFFVVEVAADTWERLDAAQRKALIDHELCHCRVEFNADGDAELAIVGHDLEEFAEVVERHGLWASDTARFGTAVAEQLALAVDEVSRFLEDESGDDSE